MRFNGLKKYRLYRFQVNEKRIQHFLHVTCSFRFYLLLSDRETSRKKIQFEFVFCLEIFIFEYYFTLK